MGSKPSQQQNTQQTYTPPASVLAAYNNVTNQAEQVASTPYQAYSGELVAGVNNQQTTGINAVNSASGIQNGYNAGATGLAAASASTIDPTQYSAQQIQQYESPYNNDVVNSTLAEINNNNQQQSSSLTGNAISSGAFGGDRAGVAQAALAGQQDLATNQTIAGLNNQNYQNAQSEFNNQQTTNLGAQQNNASRQLAASQQLGNLGSTAQTEALNEANAQTAAGTLQQTTQQNQDTAAYNQYLQKQAYPFQTTGWLANIVEGIGSQSGGTSSGQTQQQSSSTNSILGGLVGLGSFLARGGRVPHMASGGGLGGGVYAQDGLFNPTQAGSIPGVGGGSIVPQENLPIGHTMPTGSSGTGMQQAPSIASSANNIASTAKAFQGLGTSLQNSNLGQQVSGFFGMANGGGLGLADAAYANGGTVLGDAGLMRRPHFDAGGDVSTNDLLFDPSSMNTGTPQGLVVVPTPEGPKTVPASPSGGFNATTDLPPAPAIGGAVAPGTGLAPAATGADAAPIADSTFNRMIGAESGGKQFSDDGSPLVSPKGAIGIAQVMPGTGPEAAQLAGLPYDPNRLANDPAYNKALGQAYYQHQLDTFGSPDKAAAAYNAGPGALNTAIAQAAKNGGSYLDYLPSETQAYVAKVTGGAPSTALAYDAGSSGGLPGSGALGAIGSALSGGLSGSPGTTDPNEATSIDKSIGAAPGGHSGLLGLNLSDSTRTGLLAAGLGIMGSHSLNVGQAIGEGGLAGLQTMMGAAKNQSGIGLQRAQTQQVQTETQLKQQQLDLMMKALNSNAKILSGQTPITSGSSSSATTAPASGGVDAPVAPAAGTAAPASVPQKQVSPQYDPARLRAAAENLAFVNPAVAANYRDQAAQIESGKALVQFTDGTRGFLPGYNEALAGQKAAETNAEAATRANYNVKEAQPVPGGPTRYTTDAAILAAQKAPQAGAGTANGGVGVGAGSPPGSSVDAAVAADPTIAKQPAYFADRQKKIAEDEGTMSSAFQARQLSKQRIQALQGIMQNFQPGAFAQQKADFIAALNSAGIPAPPTATANPAAFQEFIKNATANVFDDVKGLGGKVLVSEIHGLTKANANPELQPSAAAAILGQSLGVINHEDQHYQDYMNWKKTNPYAYDTSGFEIPWAQKNPVSQYVSQANKGIAYSGQDIPPTQGRTVGQTYMTPKGPYTWLGSGWVPASATP